MFLPCRLPRALAAARTLLILLALLGAPAMAGAHTGLRRSEPADGARVAAPLTTIRLWFTERVQLAVTRVRFIGADSAATTLTLASDATDPRLVMAALPASLAPGDYRVEWQTGGRDGHPVRGHFRFTLLAPAPSTVAESGADSAPRTVAIPPATGNFNVTLDSMMREGADRPAARLEVSGGAALNEHRVARWAEFVGLLVVLGALVFHHLVAGGLRAGGFDLVARDASDAARQIALASLLLLVTAGAARLYGEASALRAPGESLSLEGMRALATGTEWGRGWMLGMGSTVLALGGVIWARVSGRGWIVAAIGGMGLALAPALTGHAAATRDLAPLAILVDAAHVAGAGGWLGTLLVVLMAGLPAVARRPAEERGLVAEALFARFHPVARGCVLLVLASGLISAAIRLRSIDALTHTNYGALLLYKVFIFLFAGLIGLYNWRKVLPRMRHADGPTRLRRSATVELLVGLVVLALTAALVATEPPDMQRADSSVDQTTASTR